MDFLINKMTTKQYSQENANATSDVNTKSDLSMKREMYDETCAERFGHIDVKLDTILELLKGKDREPGLIDDVRELNRFRRTAVTVLSFFGLTLVTQIAIWIRSIVTR